jgi:hypothetical protein
MDNLIVLRNCGVLIWHLYGFQTNIIIDESELSAHAINAFTAIRKKPTRSNIDIDKALLLFYAVQTT